MAHQPTKISPEAAFRSGHTGFSQRDSTRPGGTSLVGRPLRDARTSGVTSRRFLSFKPSENTSSEVWSLGPAGRAAQDTPGLASGTTQPFPTDLDYQLEVDSMTAEMLAWHAWLGVSCPTMVAY